MERLRFNVYGRIYAIVREGARWQAYDEGSEGKRRPAGFVVPDFIAEDEIAQFLADLFHENAMPHHGEVFRIP